MMIHDCHTHLRQHMEPVPPHQLEPVLESAEKRGVTVEVKEHAPLPRKLMESYVSRFGITIYDHEREPYFEQFERMKYPIGFELDYVSGMEEETLEILEGLTAEAEDRGLSVSGIHGSVHFLRAARGCEGLPGADLGYICWDLDEEVFGAYMKRRQPKQFLYDYFGAMGDLVGLGIYDALSHLELARKFDKRNASGESVYFGEYEKLYDTLARGAIEAVSEAGMALELNTAGLFRSLGRPYLSEELLKYAVELKVPISLGSDAHLPQDVGVGFDVAAQMLARAGAQGTVGFENRKQVPIPMSAFETINL